MLPVEADGSIYRDPHPNVRQHLGNPMEKGEEDIVANVGDKRIRKSRRTWPMIQAG